VLPEDGENEIPDQSSRCRRGLHDLERAGGVERSDIPASSAIGGSAVDVLRVASATAALLRRDSPGQSG
jgi:hypothetical protein